MIRGVRGVARVVQTVRISLRQQSSAAGSPGLVRIDYEDLVKGRDVSDAVFEAYGPNGLGALSIRNVPKFAELRRKVLPMSYRLAHLPESEKAVIEDPGSMWNAGWSHGKEKFGDVPDLAKGSFYANPLFDAAGTEELRKQYPFFYPRNLWPSRAMPELEPAFKSLGRVMYDAVVLLARQARGIAVPR